MDNEITNQLTPRLFHIIRHGDESGVSGLGRVLDGILWVNGQVTVMWRTDLDPKKAGMSSITTFNNYRAFEDIHVNSHPTNKTEIVWFDDLLGEATTTLEATQEELKTCKAKLKEVRKDLREVKAEQETEQEQEQTEID